MKENVLDVLMYLFETYVDTDEEPEADQNELRAELAGAGFGDAEIERALDWLDGLIEHHDDLGRSVRVKRENDARSVLFTQQLEGFGDIGGSGVGQCGGERGVIATGKCLQQRLVKMTVLGFHVSKTHRANWRSRRPGIMIVMNANAMLTNGHGWRAMRYCCLAVARRSE